MVGWKPVYMESTNIISILHYLVSIYMVWSPIKACVVVQINSMNIVKWLIFMLLCKHVVSWASWRLCSSGCKGAQHMLHRVCLLPNHFSRDGWISFKLVVNWHMLFAAIWYVWFWMCDCISALCISKGIMLVHKWPAVQGWTWEGMPSPVAPHKHDPSSCQRVWMGIGCYHCNVLCKIDRMHSHAPPPPLPVSHMNIPMKGVILLTPIDLCYSLLYRCCVKCHYQHSQVHSVPLWNTVSYSQCCIPVRYHMTVPSCFHTRVIQVVVPVGLGLGMAHSPP